MDRSIQLLVYRQEHERVIILLCALRFPKISVGVLFVNDMFSVVQFLMLLLSSLYWLVCQCCYYLVWFGQFVSVAFLLDMQVPRYASVRDFMPFLSDMQVLQYAPVHCGCAFYVGHAGPPVLAGLWLCYFYIEH